MRKQDTIRRLLSAFLAVGLLLSFLTPASAEEVSEETVSTEPAAETTSPETTAPTEPSIPETTAEPALPETTAPTETAAPETESAEIAAILPADEAAPAFSAPYELYFGLLHAHTNISDGLGSVEEAFSYAAKVEGLDFFAVTDHSNSFDNAASGSIGVDGTALSEEWAAGKAAAASVTNEGFVGIFGYEMTWQEGKGLGHLCTFGTPGWESRNQEAYQNQPTALQSYYEALTTVPGSISQFCHPGDFYGNFENFGHYSREYDNVIHLLEVGGEGSFTAFDQYAKALDVGWHLAPSISQNNHNGRWGDANSARTVVLAKELTEKSLFDAIRNHRVYASQDGDLHIWFELNGHNMGSVLSNADSPEITVSLYDPTDTSAGTVTVVTEGGTILASRDINTACETLTIPVSGGYRYYYLKVTQPDGDIAVTTPVWVESYEDIGISAFTSDTQVPVQGQEFALMLELFNQENAVFTLDSIEFYIGEQRIHMVEDPGAVGAQSVCSYSFSYTHPEIGGAQIRAVARGTILGVSLTFEETLSLRFRSGEMVTGVLVDASHGNPGMDTLANLKALTQTMNMDMTTFPDDLPRGGELLLILSPQTDLEDSFLQDVQDFARNGGSLILCGNAGDNARLNTLLETLGSTLRLNGDSVGAGSAAVFNTDSLWGKKLTENQYFTHGDGCTVEPGGGSWLVKNGSGQILLACEETAYGGTIFTAGSSFLCDTEMPQARSAWELPRANRTILQAILGSEEAVLEQQTIQAARSETPGVTCRIKGYVTAGTSNPYTTFPETIYLQDDTGGTAVTGFTAEDIQIGTPMEIIGTRSEENGNSVLTYIDHRIADEAFYRFSPRTMACGTAVNYAVHGGELLEVEGKVISLTKTDDKKGICRLVIKDIRGDSAIIEIEEGIGSGVDGINDLAKTIKKGRTVRAMGLLHRNAAGETVLRVRNCDEVVYVPPKADPTNPKTGDFLVWLAWKWKELRI